MGTRFIPIRRTADGLDGHAARATPSTWTPTDDATAGPPTGSESPFLIRRWTMGRTVFAALALAVFLPLAAQAQQWTATQQEVWEFEEACWATEDSEALMACFHDDYVGWAIGSSVPLSKEDRRPFAARSYETEDFVFLYLKPLAIKVHGNVAIVLYLATYTTKNKATGKETTVTQRWTDVCLKEGDGWTYIADHGVVISGD
jgi:ketosteroid isomerase-like protein